MLRCERLSCGYGNRPVLAGMDLQVVPGEVVAVLGTNGSGKSTFLKTICRTISPLAGRVTLDGKDAAELSYSDLAKHVSFVPQEEQHLFPFLVRDVVAMGRLSRSPGLRTTSEDIAAAETAMGRADCRSLAERRVTELSGGEKQRVLIARALAQDTELMLLDEPTSHLDVGHQLDVAGQISALAKEGKALVVAVHDLNLASLFATRVFLFHEGKLSLDAPVEQAMESKLLDVAYSVAFERIQLESGRLILVPTCVPSCTTATK